MRAGVRIAEQTMKGKDCQKMNGWTELSRLSTVEAALGKPRGPVHLLDLGESLVNEHARNYQKHQSRYGPQDFDNRRDLIHFGH